MKRERDITNGSVIKVVNIVKKRGTANSVIAESVDVIKQRKEAIAPLKLPLSLSRSASVPLVVLSWQVVFEQHRCSASTCIVTRPCSGDGQRTSTNTGVEAGVTAKNSEYQPTAVFRMPLPKGSYGVVRFRHRERGIAPVPDSRVSVGVMLFTFVAKTQSTPEQAECEGNAKGSEGVGSCRPELLFTLNQ